MGAGLLMPYMFRVIIVLSGVTKVGVTRGGNLTVSPCFPPKKKLTTFLVIALSDDFIAALSSQLPPSDVVCPVFWLNSATKNILLVAPGAVRPLP